MSHYRLAAHLMLAVTIFGCCIWFANDLLARGVRPLSTGARSMLIRALGAIGALLAIQILWGAFVAGLEAGHVHPAFPLMDGQILPPNGWHLDPVARNLVENHATVQWVYRVLATVLLAGAIALTLRIWRDAHLRRLRAWGAALAIVGILQTFLHIVTRTWPGPADPPASWDPGAGRDTA